MFSLPKYSDYFFMEYAMDTNDTYYPRFNIGINPTGICFEMTMYNKKYLRLRYFYKRYKN